MTNSIDEKELHKLSEIIIENDEIISDVNNLIKEMKSFKEIDQKTYDNYVKKCEELQLDIDDILDIIEKCQKENDPNLKSFDSNKKSSKIKAQKSKKQLDECRIKLEKRIQRNSGNTLFLSKRVINNDNESIIMKTSKYNDEKLENEPENIDEKYNEKPIDKNKMNINQSENTEGKTEEFFDETGENEKSNHMEKMKASLSSDEIENQNLRKKGILKDSFRKKNKAGKETKNKRFEDTNIENDTTDKAKNCSNDNGNSLNSLKSDELNTQIEKKSKDSKLKIRNKKKENNKDETTSSIKTKTSESQLINLNKMNAEIDKNNNENTNPILNPNKNNNKNEKKPDKVLKQTFDSKLNDLEPIAEKRNLQVKDIENIQMKNIKKEMKDKISKDINDVTDDDDYDESENDQSISVNNEETKQLTNSKSDQDLNSANKSQFLKMKTNKEDILVSVNTNDAFYNSKNEGIHSIEIKNNEGADTWNQLKQSMQEKSVNELLKSLGSLPSGFRHSTLKLWCQEKFPINNSIKSSFVAYLCPNLTESHMSLSDLQCVISTKQIRPQQVRIQRQIQIMKVTQIPLISNKFIVKSRHVRICLFDGLKAVSNIHTMRATVNEKDLKIWNFNSKMTEIMKSLDYNEIFIRSNHPSTENTILMEFCILGFKTKLKLSNEISINKVEETYTDDELIELSIGWTIIPLYETNGQLLNSKKSDYILNGGTPFEKNLEVDTDIKSENPGILKSLTSQNKQPRVTVRIYIPNKDSKDLLETLPNEIIGSTLHLVILSFYRRILASEILDGRQDLTSARPVYSPFLTSFVEASNYSDILDILRIIWNEKIKSTKTINRKDYGKLNKFFEKIYMDFIYPLTKINLFSYVNLANPELEQNRINIINEFVQRAKQDTLSVLLSDEYTYTPLRFEEFNFNMISKYSKLVSL